MKNTLLILLFCLGWFNQSYAQKSKLNALFDQYQDTPGVTTIRIAKPMFNMLSHLDIQQDEMAHIKPFLDKLDGLQILVVESDQDSEKNISTSALQTEINASLRTLNYKELMSVQSQDSKIKFLAGDALDGVFDDLLLSVHSGTDTVLLMLDGKLSMKDINNIAAAAQNSNTQISNTDSQGHGANQSVVQQVRNVGSFRGITVGNGIKATIAQGKSTIVKVTADSDKLDRVRTAVSNGILLVDIQNKGLQPARFKTLHVEITTPFIDEISASAGSQVVGLTPISSQTINIAVSSGASIEADLRAAQSITIEGSSGAEMLLKVAAPILNVKASSAMKGTLSGKVDKATIQSSSAASIKAGTLELQTADVQISSASEVTLNVARALTGKISSAAKVLYLGNPSIDSNLEVSSGGKLNAK